MRTLAYLGGMRKVAFEPCIPTRAARRKVTRIVSKASAENERPDVPGLRKLGDVLAGVLESDELATARQRNRIFE